MTWSYSDALTEAKDRIRVLVGDTDEDDRLISDEAIALYLSGGAMEQASERLSAAHVAELIAATFARQAVSISAGGTAVNWGDQAKRFRDLAAALRAADAADAESDLTGLFDWAEQIPDDFARRERFTDERLRSTA